MTKLRDRVVQIVPRRALAHEGIGDCATRIAEQFSKSYGIETRFIACTPLPPNQRRKDRWETSELPRRGAAELATQLEEIGDVPVVLHLSGYGYHRKGVPLWVADAVARWRRSNPNRRLLTVFHELYATSPIWRSPFWISGLQKLAARRIYRSCSAAIATTEGYVTSLRAWEPGGPPVSWLPSFAAIGEPEDTLLPTTVRPNRLVVFGRANLLDSVYGEHLPALEAFVRANHIEEIVDIGARPQAPPSKIAGLPLRALGELPETAVLAELMQARFGLLHYWADRLAKSGIFGALCACGTIPVCISEEPGVSDQLVPGMNYLRFDPRGLPPAPQHGELDGLQANSLSWYEPHSIAATVEMIYKALA